MSIPGMNSHQHPAQDTKGPTRAGYDEMNGPQGERAWASPKYDNHWPNIGIQVEFVTKFGERHYGLSVGISERRPIMGARPMMRDSMNSVLIMSETSSTPEYFTPMQVERWRETDYIVPKKRLLGSTDFQNIGHQGMILPLFIHYVMLRFIEKLKELDSPQSLPYPSTYHYQMEDKKNMFETSIYFSNRGIRFTELEGDEAVLVTFEGDARSSAPEPKGYDFRRVQVMAEDVCAFLISGEI